MANKKINKFFLDLLGEDEKIKSYLDKYYNLPNRMNSIISNLKLYKESSVFLNKVTKKEAPDYHTIIKNPIDLGTIQKKIPKYVSYSEFKDDLDLVWTNCYTYNAGPYYIYCADTMKRAVETQVISREAVCKDPGFVAYEIQIEGILSQGGIIREELKKIIVRLLRSSEFESCSSLSLEILCDVLENKLCEFFKKM